MDGVCKETLGLIGVNEMIPRKSKVPHIKEEKLKI